MLIILHNVSGSIAEGIPIYSLEALADIKNDSGIYCVDNICLNSKKQVSINMKLVYKIKGVVTTSLSILYKEKVKLGDEFLILYDNVNNPSCINLSEPNISSIDNLPVSYKLKILNNKSDILNTYVNRINTCKNIDLSNAEYSAIYVGMYRGAHLVVIVPRDLQSESIKCLDKEKINFSKFK